MLFTTSRSSGLTTAGPDGSTSDNGNRYRSRHELRLDAGAVSLVVSLIGALMLVDRAHVP